MVKGEGKPLLACFFMYLNSHQSTKNDIQYNSQNLEVIK